MSIRRHGRFRIGWVLLGAGLAAGYPAAKADAWVPLSGSIVAIPAGGGAASAGPAIVRTRLLPSESEATIDIEIALKMRNLPGLQARLAAGQRIARSDMEANYYPLPADYEAVAAWIAGQGLTLTLQDSSRLDLFASGPVWRVSHAFRLTMARVAWDSAEYTSAVSPPSVPAALAPVILGVNGLQTHIRARKHSIVLPLQGNSTTGNGPPFLPSQIALAYQASGLSETGAGQTIAIVIDTFPSTSDLTSFWSICNVGQSLANIDFIQVVGGTLPAPSGEETIDVEWSSSIASAAKVRVYATLDLSFTHIDEAYTQIFNDLLSQPQMHLVSLSFGVGETYVSTSTLQTEAQLLANLASAGLTVFVASGDGGSNPGSTGSPNSGPLQVETPASDLSVTAVGGTSLTVNSATGSESSEVAWSDSGGGLSIFTGRPSWQIGNGVPAGAMRCVPDVASVADPSTGGFLIFSGQEYIFGGTSWGAPVWAGFAALVNQSRAEAGLSSLGLLGPAVYPLLGSANFRDITSGSNGAYSAGPGFDLCTGIGVADVSALLDALPPIPSEPAMPPWALAALALLLYWMGSLWLSRQTAITATPCPPPRRTGAGGGVGRGVGSLPP